MPKVNMHAHSSRSDGELTPVELAEWLSSRGADYVALTDHDDVSGAREFRRACDGPRCVEGVELSCVHGGASVHLLAYWIDGRRPAWKPDRKRRGVAQATDAIRSIRSSGGAVFMAHPLTTEPDRAALERMVDQLCAAGLDGLEARYPAYDGEAQAYLAALAHGKGLAVSAGTDLHAPGAEGQPAWIEVDEAEWRGFRDLLLSRSPVDQSPTDDRDGKPRARRLQRRRFALGMALPAMLAAALFSLALFALVLPRVEFLLLESKKELIREVTESAASVLGEYAREAASGRMTLERAQAEAVARIRDVRYGRESKDYFWITDETPRMIMHPYREELDGADLTDFRDDAGTQVFVEFVRAVREAREGYVEYLWQWKDDESRIASKLSYVKEFEPWGWIIGTGVYLDDVRAETADLTRDLTGALAAIAIAVALALAFLARQGLRSERARIAAEAEGAETRERYRALAEAAGEGTVMVVDGACVFATSAFLELSGYASAELQLLSPEDLFSPWPDSGDEAIAFMSALRSGEAVHAPEEPFECAIPTKSGRTLEAVVEVAPVEIRGRPGFALAVREAAARRRGEIAARPISSDDADEPARMGPTVAWFKARLDERGTLEEADAALWELLSGGDPGKGLFSSMRVEDAHALRSALRGAGSVADFRARIDTPGMPSRAVSVSATTLAPSEDGEARAAGILYDAGRVDAEKAIAQEALAGLPSTVALAAAAVGGTGLRVRLSTSLKAAAAELRGERVAALLVGDEARDTAGYLGPREISDAIARGLHPADANAASAMRAPLSVLGAGASVAEAAEAMERDGADAIGVRGPSGSIEIVGWKDLAVRSSSAGAFERRLAAATCDSDLAAAARLAFEEAHALFAGGLEALQAARMLAARRDAIARRAVELASDGMGEAPAAWALLALGSDGRLEPTTGSDQDYAVAWAGERDEARQRWFLALGSRLEASLERAGIPRCPGGMGAASPRWNDSAIGWAATVARMARAADGQAALDANSIADARCVCGSAEAANSLTDSLWHAVREAPEFSAALASSVRETRIPQGAPRSSAEAKEAVAAFAKLVRFLSLARGVRASGTVARLEALADAGYMGRDDAREYGEAYADLFRVKFAHSCGKVPGGARLESLARAATAKAATLQRAIGYDFGAA
jgi:PAS domain S-box-containing protein